MAAALTALLVVRALVPADIFRASSAAVENYSQILGTVYAVLLAFVVFVVWSKLNEARSVVMHEAKDLRDLLRLASGFEVAMGARLAEAVRTYIRTVIDEEWALMVRGEASPRAARQIEQVGEQILALEPASARQEALYGEMLVRFDELTDARAQRLMHSRARMPGSLWTLVLVGSVMTIGSIFLFGVTSLALHALLTAAMSGSVTFILFLVSEMDNPFCGDWRVRPEPLLHLVEEMP